MPGGDWALDCRAEGAPWAGCRGPVDGTRLRGTGCGAAGGSGHPAAGSTACGCPAMPATRGCAATPACGVGVADPWRTTRWHGGGVGCMAGICGILLPAGRAVIGARWAAFMSGALEAGAALRAEAGIPGIGVALPATAGTLGIEGARPATVADAKIGMVLTTSTGTAFFCRGGCCCNPASTSRAAGACGAAALPRGAYARQTEGGERERVAARRTRGCWVSS